MSDTAAPAQSAPQQNAPAPAQGSPSGESNAFKPSPSTVAAFEGEQPKPGQQRGPDGKFAGQPGAEPPKPKSGRERLADLVDDEGNVTLKLNGKPTKMSIDRALAEMEVEFAGKQRFTEADKRAKQAEQLLAAFEKDPDAVFRARGIDPHEWAKRKAWEAIQREEQEAALTPEQRQLREYENQLRTREQTIQQAEQERQEAELQQHNERYSATLMEHGPASLKAVGLPVDHPGAIDALKQNLRPFIEAGHGITPETVRLAAEQARDDLFELATPILHASPEEFVSRFGKDADAFLNRLRKYDLEQYEKRRSGGAPVLPSQAQPVTQKQPEPQRYMTEAEWKAEQRKRGFL